METAKLDNTQEIIIAPEKYVLGGKNGSPWLAPNLGGLFCF